MLVASASASLDFDGNDELTARREIACALEDLWDHNQPVIERLTETAKTRVRLSGGASTLVGRPVHRPAVSVMPDKNSSSSGENKASPEHRQTREPRRSGRF